MVSAIVVFGLATVWMQQADSLTLPDGNNTWLVEVITSGGFTGRGAGYVMLSSEGKIICERSLQCPKEFEIAGFQRLIEMLGDVPPPATRTPLTTVCNDCITRSITVSYRDSMGAIHIYTASWDDITKSTVAQQLIRLYDAVWMLLK